MPEYYLVHSCAVLHGLLLPLKRRFRDAEHLPRLAQHYLLEHWVMHPLLERYGEHHVREFLVIERETRLNIEIPAYPLNVADVPLAQGPELLPQHRIEIFSPVFEIPLIADEKLFRPGAEKHDLVALFRGCLRHAINRNQNLDFHEVEFEHGIAFGVSVHYLSLVKMDLVQGKVKLLRYLLSGFHVIAAFRSGHEKLNLRVFLRYRGDDCGIEPPGESDGDFILQ